MEWYLFQFDTKFMLSVLIRLLAACFLGGIIGFEREYSKHKPAGFRTHILVSMGSCLVMLISQFAIIAYQGVSDIDPTRIGAQVVSGIGFLGAGAIIRHGVSVKGITTAASIWAVACVGLACGIGFYIGAVIATLFIWAVLIYLKVIEDRLLKKANARIIEVEAETQKQIILPLGSILKEFNLTIKNLEILDNHNNQKQKIICHLESCNKALDFTLLSAKIYEIEGVFKVSI